MISRSPKEFEELVAEALDAMPEEFQARLENIVVTIENEPSREDLDALDIPRRHTLFGLYAGTPLTQRDANFAALPDRIVLFRGPILRACDTPAEVIRQVCETVVHEIGHFFGLSDAELP